MLVPLGLLVMFCSTVAAKEIRVAVRQNVTMPCPNVPADLVDEKSFKVNFHELAAVPNAPPSLTNDQLTLISADGQRLALRFPSCYRVELRFRLSRPLANPYVETFLQMGQSLPCQTEMNAPTTVADNICANISRPAEWCPKSTNSRLRRMTESKSTCRFCNLCDRAKTADSSLGRYLQPERRTATDQCRTDRLEQRLQFKVCTPDRKTMVNANEESEGRYEQYWHYLKQGVLSIVIHVADRRPFPPPKTQQCRRLCSTLDNGRSRSESYKRTLLKTISSMCTPDDDYVACAYHTLKFDVLDQL